MSRRTIEYSPEELAWIEANSKRQRPDAWAEFVRIFGRADVSLSNYSALCKRNRWFTGQTGRFIKGQGGWNKGQRMPFHPNSAATRFKAGAVARNLKPIGEERIGRDGYIEVKVDRVNPYTGAWGHYVHKQPALTYHIEIIGVRSDGRSRYGLIAPLAAAALGGSDD